MKKLKISFIFETTLLKGGQFTMAFENLMSLSGLSEDSLVLVRDNESLNFLKKKKIKCEKYKINLFDKLFLIFNNFYLGKRLLKKFGIFSCIEKKLLKNKSNLVFFLDDSSCDNLFREINTATTVMDICHFEFPELPEVKNNFEYEYREEKLKRLNKNTLIIVESDELKENISKIYNIQKNKIFSLPNAFIKNSHERELEGISTQKLLDFAKLLPENYFFYPAQYWPHKNHNIILEAANLLKKKGLEKKFVFCGNDMGNLTFLRKKVDELNLVEYFTFFNFLKDSQVDYLYKNCEAVIMPTFFGPTNIPLFNAWHYKKIIFYSSHLKNKFDECAVYCDPLDSLSWANALAKFDINKKFYQNILSRSSDMLFFVQEQRRKNLENISSYLIKYRKIISTYS
jgi:glycosyltransferase involved in cell wall biosynthesis